MCGIAGITSKHDTGETPSLELLSSMVGAIRHRGPDEFGMYRDDHAGLVHARLSIIDLVTGQQPLSNEDGSLWITFNGEIFNYVELRKELELLGHKFRTHSDTEVIVHAYEAWGHGCFQRFNGQWSLALWNERTRSLVLSRDRIGVRPLYIQEDADHIRFASEVKSIFQDPRVSRELDPHGIQQTFTYWTSIAPTTPFKGVEELPPATVRTYDARGHHHDIAYWTPTYPIVHGGPQEDFSLTFEEAAEVLREKLAVATRLRMVRSDVPVGSYLSGGLDSSLIARMGRDAKEGEFSTFSIRFEDGEFDETSFQRTMASTMNSSHREVVVRRSDIAKAFPDVIRHTERPILRTAPTPLFLLSAKVREAGIKAVLTGEGADEMLAGYDLFREAKIREFWSHEPTSKARPRLFERLYPYLARSPQMTKGMAIEFWKRGLENAGKPGFSHEPRWSTTSAIKRFLTDEWRHNDSTVNYSDVLTNVPDSFAHWDTLAQAQYLEVSTLLSGYLMSSQGDRMLMAHSVEGRFPFLDVDVIEFCNLLPAHYKLSLLKEKHILKRAAKGLVPESIIQRQKQPYRAPDAASFIGGDAPEYVQTLFSEQALRQSGIFDHPAVTKLYRKCAGMADRVQAQGLFSNSDNMSFVGILSTQLLHQMFIAEPPRRSPNRIEFSTIIDRVTEHSH